MALSRPITANEANRRRYAKNIQINRYLLREPKRNLIALMTAEHHDALNRQIFHEIVARRGGKPLVYR